MTVEGEWGNQAGKVFVEEAPEVRHDMIMPEPRPYHGFVFELLQFEMVRMLYFLIRFHFLMDAPLCGVQAPAGLPRQGA